MNINDIKNRLAGHNGQHIAATWARKLKTRAGIAANVVKKTTCYVRAGIDFSHLNSVQSGIANGERGQVQTLPWGHWVQFPIHIEHKGQDYVRLYPASFDNLRPQVEYLIDGQPASKEDCTALCLASEFKTGEEKPECFTVKADSIISIG